MVYYPGWVCAVYRTFMSLGLWEKKNQTCLFVLFGCWSFGLIITIIFIIITTLKLLLSKLIGIICRGEFVLVELNVFKSTFLVDL